MMPSEIRDWRLQVALSSCFVLVAASVWDKTPIDSLPLAPPRPLPAANDYLVGGVEARAAVYCSADGRDVVLDNGLVRRTFRLSPNLACSGFENLMTGEAIVRAVRPEAELRIDGRPLAVGGWRTRGPAESRLPAARAAGANGI